MFIFPNPVGLYCNKVITDVQGRNGYTTSPLSFSCLPGRRHKVLQYLSYDRTTTAILDDLFNGQADYDADVDQPMIGAKFENAFELYDRAKGDDDHKSRSVVYDPAVNNVDWSPDSSENLNKSRGYFRRLEDIYNEYILTYIDNLVLSIRLHSDSLKSYKANHQDQFAIMTSGDDGDGYLVPSDMLMDIVRDGYSDEQIEEARTNITYVMRRLHNMSRLYGIHMISFAVAFMRADAEKRAKRESGSTTSYLKWTDVTRYGVYYSDNMGNAKKRIYKESRSEKAQGAFDWAIGAWQVYPGYLKDFFNFQYYLEVLDIDLTSDFQNIGFDYIMSLNILKVTPNTQYESLVYDSIIHDPKDRYNIVERNSDNIMDSFMEHWYITMQESEDLAQRSDSMNADGYRNMIANIFKLLLALYPNLNPTDCKFKDGWLYNGNDLVIVDYLAIDPPSKTDYVSIYRSCLISELALIVRVTDDPHIIAMDTTGAYINYCNKLSGIRDKSEYQEWFVYD